MLHAQVLDQPNVDGPCHRVVLLRAIVIGRVVHAVQGARGLHAAVLTGRAEGCIRVGPGPQLSWGVVHCVLVAVEGGQRLIVAIPLAHVAQWARQSWLSAASPLPAVLGEGRETAASSHAVLCRSLTVARCLTVQVGS